VRDVTATVESIPLIVSSILSKKVAAGLDGLVMDVKCGSGAFCDTEAMAREPGREPGLRRQPGGAVDHRIDHRHGPGAGPRRRQRARGHGDRRYLTGEGARDPRLHEVVMALAGEMLALGDLAPSVAAGRARAEAALMDGRAAEKFARMVSGLAGPTTCSSIPAAMWRALL